MSTTAIMKTSTLTIGSYINADKTNYTFTLAASIPLPATSKLRITFPTEVTLPSTSDLVCSSPTTNSINRVKCSLNVLLSNTVDVSFDLKLNPLPAERVF